MTGGLKTSDPLNPQVIKWWNDKVKGDLLFDSRFWWIGKSKQRRLPGPQDFGRNHADGANMLADALNPFGGICDVACFCL